MPLLRGKAVGFDSDKITDLLLSQAATDGLNGKTTDRQYLAVLIVEMKRLNANIERLLAASAPPGSAGLSGRQ